MASPLLVAFVLGRFHELATCSTFSYVRISVGDSIIYLPPLRNYTLVKALFRENVSCLIHYSNFTKIKRADTT